jgi:hypothetical protein
MRAVGRGQAAPKPSTATPPTAPTTPAKTPASIRTPAPARPAHRHHPALQPLPVQLRAHRPHHRGHRHRLPHLRPVPVPHRDIYTGALADLTTDPYTGNPLRRQPPPPTSNLTATGRSATAGNAPAPLIRAAGTPGPAPITVNWELSTVDSVSMGLSTNGQHLVPRMPHMPRGEAKVSGSGQGKPSASLIYGSRGCRFESCRARTP